MTKKNSQPSEIQQSIIDLVKETEPNTVEHLIEQVQERYPLSKHEILEHIVNLQNQGKISLKNHPASTPLTFKNYLFSNQSYWYWTVSASAIVTTLLVFIIPEDAYPFVYARYILGSIFVLWLPGYSLIKALFPTKEMDQIERIALSIGMSLALVPITGLLLNYTPWGIRIIPVTLTLLALTLILATAALLREHQIKTKTP